MRAPSLAVLLAALVMPAEGFAQSTDRSDGRLGAAALTALDGEVRANPTVGVDIKLGAAR
jgi:hypothetical protein